ncbi:hypothetical protein [Actinacidiphila oryziradicis]|uniref:hypothetical protein n=1 Tax=Actinacidiphila oryziradicis TaxID=2571141 RepID=UPI0023F02B68|nr:hypothetical protein [Actinacidiphila oryziradicis]MCW2873526.1 hypothetical protein [Actinacidiphila oryziradicis]
MSSSVSIDLPWYAKLVFKAGRPVVLVAALLMSIPGEIHLAIVAGWTPGVARLMPVCVSVYAACSAVIADVAKRRGLPSRRSALVGAVAALALALSAQDISHLIQQNYMHSSAVLVAFVSAVPPMVVAHMLHMAAAPAETASVVEVQEVSDEAAEGLEDDYMDDDMPGNKNGRQTRRGGRKGLSEEEVEAAIARLRVAGEKVNPENLGAVLNRSSRTARRYLTNMKRAEVAKAADKDTADGMLPMPAM